jgi:hypothetical protein
MPSLIGTDIAANYRQQNVPFSRFGTRKIAWFKIGSADVADGGGVLDMAAFNAVIDAIQTRAEIVTVGAPYINTDTGWNKFMVAVFEDTFNDGANTDDGANDKATTLQTALREVTNDGSLYVERFYLYGAPGGGSDSPDEGFSSNPTYQEYDLKADFEANSYTK